MAQPFITILLKTNPRQLLRGKMNITVYYYALPNYFIQKLAWLVNGLKNNIIYYHKLMQCNKEDDAMLRHILIGLAVLNVIDYAATTWAVSHGSRNITL